MNGGVRGKGRAIGGFNVSREGVSQFLADFTMWKSGLNALDFGNNHGAIKHGLE